MAKRKIETGLEDIVMTYLKKIKCERTSKMFGTEHSSEILDHSKSLKKFMTFLEQNQAKNEYSAKDDLGFEINFGAFQPEAKVSFLCSKFQKIVHINLI